MVPSYKFILHASSTTLRNCAQTVQSNTSTHKGFPMKTTTPQKRDQQESTFETTIPTEAPVEPALSDQLASDLDTVATKEQVERDRQREAELARQRELAQFD